MSAVAATLDVSEDFSAVVANMLRQFPKGARVKLEISEVAASGPTPGLEEYRQMVAAARVKAPRSPWQTAAETMKGLREGEQD